jgi:REP element-mobilizing transposase RayT
MSHTFTHLLYHVIFSTKDRRPLITRDFQHRLYEYAGGVAKKELGCALALGGTENHLHALISLRPPIGVPTAVGKLKSLTTGWVNRTLKPKDRFKWQQGYAAFTVADSIRPDVESYIAGQAEHHRKVTYEEEFIAFLKRHHIPFDPETMWG